MRFASSTTVALLAGASCVESFSVQPSLTRVRQGASFSRGMAASSQTDFDSILGEGSSYREAANTIRTTRRSDSSSSPVIRVPDGSPAATVTLASSVAAADVFGDDLALEDEMAVDALMEEELANENPLMNNEILQRQHDKKVQKEEFKSAGGVMRYVKNPLLLVKGKDFSDITITIIIPAIASFYVLKKGAGIVQTKLTAKAQNLLHSCSDEIRYHTGDMELISRIYGDFKKKLWFHGAPSFIATEILTEFCAVYPAHQPITAASVETFAHMISLTKSTDIEVAECMKKSCDGNREINRRQQLLFYAGRLLKDKKAHNILKPIKKELASLSGGTEYMLETQKRMGENSYRFSLTAKKHADQTKLPKGWKTLGLDEETATAIFEEQKKAGFLNPLQYQRKQDANEKEAIKRAEKENMENMIEEYGLMAALNKSDEYDPDKDYDKDYENKDGQTRRCRNCGYTLFIAAGREHKFFGEGYKCPECGEGRDQFKNVINLYN